jgi:MFS family permease
VLSAYSTLQGAGQAIGPVLAGYLIAAHRFDLAFLLAGAIALSTPVIVWRWPATARRAGTRTVFKTVGRAFTARLARRKAAPSVSFEAGSSERSTLQQFSDGIKEVARERRVLVASLAQSAQFLLNGSLNAFLPLYAIEVMGMSAAAVGWMFAMQMVTTLATRPAIGVLSDRIGRRGVIITGLATCSAAVWMTSTAESVSLLLAAVFLYAGGVAVTTAATSAYVTDVAPRARYGTAHGVFGTIYDVGDAAGPIVAGLLVAAWGYAPMFQVMAIVAAAAAAVFYVFSTAGGEVPT